MPAGPATVSETAKGKTLVDAKGMTLYTFDRDAGGKSVCNGPCATNWPPLMAVANAKTSGDWSVLARDDGAMQWAYRGRPLYTWSKDTKPGDITGDGFLNGAWHVAQP
jgi:predicted lipoprotein with Yx(FWY)xxD motif